MKRLLIMCEGPNEKAIIDILLANDCLSFSQDDLLGLTPFHARQITGSGQVRAELNLFPGQVDVYRIGDKQSDRLVIPRDYRGKICEVRKYCTKPELEMLLIIAEGLEKEFDKVKSKITAKEFAKRTIKLDKKHYDNSSSFYRDYFSGRVDLLVGSIRKYQKIKGKSHAKGELCLSELLKP